MRGGDGEEEGCTKGSAMEWVHSEIYPQQRLIGLKKVGQKMTGLEQ